MRKYLVKLTYKMGNHPINIFEGEIRGFNGMLGGPNSIYLTSGFEGLVIGIDDIISLEVTYFF